MEIKSIIMIKGTKLKLTFIYFVLFFNIITVFPYPIEPVPLRKLVMKSEFIVIGHVRVYSENEHIIYFKDKAEIRILEVLQGNLSDKTIVLNLESPFMCPAPARYYDATYTLAFLNRDKNGDLYTNGRSYGSKTLSLSQIEVYKKRITELQKILTVKDSTERVVKIVEWLIKCSDNPVTRWEGVYELAPDYTLQPTIDNEYFCTPPVYQLNDNQKNKMKEILYSIDTLTSGDIRLADIFLLSDSAEIKNWLKDKLRDKKYSSEFTQEMIRDRIYFISNPRKEL